MLPTAESRRNDGAPEPEPAPPPPPAAQPATLEPKPAPTPPPAGRKRRHVSRSC
jgi:hypothetical protein